MLLLHSIEDKINKKRKTENLCCCCCWVHWISNTWIIILFVLLNWKLHERLYNLADNVFKLILESFSCHRWKFFLGAKTRAWKSIALIYTIYIHTRTQNINPSASITYNGTEPHTLFALLNLGSLSLIQLKFFSFFSRFSI